MRFKGPQYPSYGLSDAVVNAGIILNLNQNQTFSRYEFASIFGYSSLNGAADKSIGTMRQFGVLENPAAGLLRLSELSIEIFRANDERKSVALREAALSPAAFRMIRNNYASEIPLLDDLASFLISQGFSDRSTRPIFNAYAKTFKFLHQKGITI